MKIAEILVGLFVAACSLAWIKIKYDLLVDDLTRDIGFNRMWHERIMDEHNELE